MRLQPENQESIGPAGLYIHVPFCARKCPYCDFYSTIDLHRAEAFLQGLEKEIALLEPATMVFDTLYLGGGTPSVLDGSQIHRIIDAAHGRFSFTDNPEITIEANPGTLSLDALKSWQTWGVNRINLGVQSFRNDHLRFLGRIHTAEEARQAIRMVQKVGVANLGLDFIYGLPNQTPEQWLEDLREATCHRPEHLACYMLTYEKGTPLEAWYRQDRFQPLSNGAVRDLFDLTSEYLAGVGYEQYEISNYSRAKAFRSKHNQKYWNHIPYIGLGPSAHSFVKARRSWNYADLDQYLLAVENGILPIEDEELLDQRQLMLETVFLGLRMIHGIDLHVFKARYGVGFEDCFGPALDTLKERGLYHLISLSSHRCGFTREGRAFTDAIAGVFAEHLNG